MIFFNYSSFVLKQKKQKFKARATLRGSYSTLAHIIGKLLFLFGFGFIPLLP